MNIETLKDILFHNDIIDKYTTDQLAEQVAYDGKLIDLLLGSIKRPQDYDNKSYHKNFIMKNADKIKEKIECSICCGSYTYLNKSKHLKSKKHIKVASKYKDSIIKNVEES
jgi:hypothetical protein